MKLLKNIKLPKGFENAEGCRVEVDEEPQLIYEGYVFTSELNFEVALS